MDRQATRNAWRLFNLRESPFFQEPLQAGTRYPMSLFVGRAADTEYQQLSMSREAELVCRGVLKGIYDFGKECSSEFKELAVDTPGEYFGQVLYEWKKLVGRRQPIVGMMEFLKTHCAEWAEWAVRSLRLKKR